MLNLKKGYNYIIINLASVLIFSILYYLCDLYNKEINDPWNYWLYFSLITQTTVGYNSIEFKKKPSSDFLNLKHSLTKKLMLLQLISIIVINGLFYL